MNARMMTNVQVFCATLGCCLGLTAGVAAQSGMALTADGQSPAALTPQQDADWKQVQVMDNTAALALHMKRYAEAEADARQAIAAGSYSGIAQDILAEALDAQGKTQEALEAYQKMATGGSSHPRGIMPYALLLLNYGQWTLALAAYEKALPYVANGQLLLAGDNFSPSVPQPVALAAAIHIARGLTFNAEGDWARMSQDDRALAEYQKAMQLAPDSDLVNYYYGYGLERVGHTAQASAAFQKTIKMAHGGVKLAAVKALKKLKAKPA